MSVCTLRTSVLSAYLVGALFIGFTHTPIEKADANTRTLFGDCF